MTKKQITTTDVYGKKHTADADNLKLSIHVYGIAVENGKALIVPQFNGYDWPGGTLELGETHTDTLKREFKEETGYDVEPIKLLNAYTSFFHHHKYNKDIQSLFLFYAAKITGGSISTDGFDADEKEYAQTAKWVPISDLPNLHHACSIPISSELIAFANQLNK